MSMEGWWVWPTPLSSIPTALFGRDLSSHLLAIASLLCMYLYQASVPFHHPQLPISINIASAHFPQFPTHLLLCAIEAEPMKQILHSTALLLFLVVLVFSSSTTKSSARMLTPKQVERGVRLNRVTNGVSLLEMQGNDFFELMGVEDCENRDDECLKRRITSEAHLDYIYTQRHKP